MIPRLCLCLLTLTAAVACGSPNSTYQPTPMTEEDMGGIDGASLFKSLGCGNCHGEDGVQDPLMVAAGNLGASTLSEDNVFIVLSDGRGQMPNYASLEENERWALVAYVLGLREE